LAKREIITRREPRRSGFDRGALGDRRGLHWEMMEWCRGRWWIPRLLFLFWFAYMLVRYIADPAYRAIFGALNLAIHEIGHILWSPFGEFMGFLGGSLTQCLAPLVSMLLFYRQRDFFAIAFCFGWLSTNLHEVSVYIDDARTQALPLVTPGGGEPMHDWFYLLNRLGLLQMDHAIAFMVRGLGVLSMLVFLVVGGYQCWLMFRLPKPENPWEM
jgi:hypothetical protein